MIAVQENNIDAINALLINVDKKVILEKDVIRLFKESNFDIELEGKNKALAFGR